MATGRTKAKTLHDVARRRIFHGEPSSSAVTAGPAAHCPVPVVRAHSFVALDLDEPGPLSPANGVVVFGNADRNKSSGLPAGVARVRRCGRYLSMLLGGRVIRADPSGT